MNETRTLPVRVGVTQHLDALQVQGAPELVATVIVPQMRARLVRDLAGRGLRPVDGWPAVKVRRYVWTTPGEYAAAMGAGFPSGMRPAREDEEPALYQLELFTDAIPDPQQVIL